MPVGTIPYDQVTFRDGRPQAYLREKASRNVRGYQCRATQLTPRLDLLQAGEPVAIDCEGGILDNEVGKNKNALSRVGIVNAVTGKCLYDTFVFYPADVPHRPDPQWLKLGVKYKDILEKNGAQPHAEVLKNIKAILDKSGLIIFHAAKSDINMMRGLDFCDYEIRDTQKFSQYRRHSNNGVPALKVLASIVLGKSIQEGEHSPVVDALATAELYMLHKATIDLETGSTRTTPTSPGTDNAAVSETTTSSSPPSSSSSPPPSPASTNSTKSTSPDSAFPKMAPLMGALPDVQATPAAVGLMQKPIVTTPPPKKLTWAAIAASKKP